MLRDASNVPCKAKIATKLKTFASQSQLPRISFDFLKQMHLTLSPSYMRIVRARNDLEKKTSRTFSSKFKFMRQFSHGGAIIIEASELRCTQLYCLITFFSASL
jgi:hypothetical protein